MKTRFALIFAASIAAVRFSTPLHANLVADPDFSTFLGDNGDGNADFTSWNLEGNTGYDSEGLDSSSGVPATTGWTDGAVGSEGYQSQVLATALNTEYEITFWLYRAGGNVDEDSVVWNGTTIWDDTDGIVTSANPYMNDTTGALNGAVADGTWQEISIDPFSGGYLNIELDLGIRNDPSFDSITAIDVAPVNGVPDASASAQLLGLGLLGLGALRRRFGRR